VEDILWTKRKNILRKYEFMKNTTLTFTWKSIKQFILEK